MTSDQPTRMVVSVMDDPVGHRLGLCFVITPYGRKPTPHGEIDFDAIYADLHEPAIRAAGLEPVRADREMVGGIIHRPMFERLVLCRFALVDLTLENANVYYELGIRHATREFSTVATFATGTRLPFDIRMWRGVPYDLSPDRQLARGDEDRATLAAALSAAAQARTDSPLFQLLDGMRPPDVSRLKTDVFHARVDYSRGRRAQLDAARKSGLQALLAFRAALGPLHDDESGLLVDLLLALRDVGAWPEMVALIRDLDPALQRTVMVREQLGLALNRMGPEHSAEAEQVLLELIGERGTSSETNGILGRVYKDRFLAARGAGRTAEAAGALRRAIATYLAGFEADWRDAYPGINALTLMELAEPPDPRRDVLRPVVRYAVERRLAQKTPDYWDHATRLELAVLALDREAALDAAGDAVACAPKPWMAATTLANLRLIEDARCRRGAATPWFAATVEEPLRAVADRAD